MIEVGQLRRWLDHESPDDVIFLLLEPARLQAAGGEMLDGWRVLEDGVLKSIYQDVILHYSEVISEC